MNALEIRIVTSFSPSRFAPMPQGLEEVALMLDKPAADSDLIRANEALVLTLLRTQTETLRASYLHVLARVYEAVIETDADLRITAFNQAAVNLYGWTVKEALGRKQSDVTNRAARKDTGESPKEGTSQWKQVHRRKGGAPFHVTGTTTSLPDMTGRITGYVSIIHDETAARLAEAREREMEMAREIQNSLLPGPLSVEGWNLTWRLQPHDRVGGDLTTFISAGGYLRCLVADVTGKGVAAALSVRMVHQIFNSTGHLPLAAAMEQLNLGLATPPSVYGGVSCVMLEFHPESEIVSICNAGHPYPMVLRAGDAVEECMSSDTVAGWFENTEYNVYHLNLAAGDRLLVYTDGLTDALTVERDRIEASGVRALFVGAAALSIEQAADCLLSAAVLHQVDDVSLLLIERLERPESSQWEA